MVQCYSSYGLGEVVKGFYEFVWNDVCDWYLELSKCWFNFGENFLVEVFVDQWVVKQVLVKVISQMYLMLYLLMFYFIEEFWYSVIGELEIIFLVLQFWLVLDESVLDDVLEVFFVELIGVICVVCNLCVVVGFKFL